MLSVTIEVIEKNSFLSGVLAPVAENAATDVVGEQRLAVLSGPDEMDPDLDDC